MRIQNPYQVILAVGLVLTVASCDQLLPQDDDDDGGGSDPAAVLPPVTDELGGGTDAGATAGTDTGTTPPVPPGDDSTHEERWQAAFAVLQAKCFGCHSDTGSANFATFDFATEEEFIASRFISAGSVDQSVIVTKSIGYNDDANMPIGLEWSPEEYEILRGWVEGLGDDGEQDPVPALSTFSGYTCTDSPGPTPVSEVKRKSKRELTRKLSDLAHDRLADQALAAQIMTDLQPRIDLLPDPSHEAMDIFDQGMGLATIEPYYNLAYFFADAVTDTPALMAEFSGQACMADATPSATCIDDTIATLSLWLSEKEATATDLTQMRLAYAADTDRPLRGLITTMLMSPYSLYHLYYDGTGNNGRYNLNGVELAYRLSYFLWESIPDATLMNAATNGSLGEMAGYQAQVDRMLDHPRFARGSDAYFRNWFKLDHLPELDLTAPRIQTKLGLFSISDSEQLLADVKEDALAFSRWIMTNDHSYDDLLLSRRSFAPAGELASNIYQVDPAVSDSDPSVEHNEGRAGIFTRAFFHWYGTATSRPILNGAKIYHDFLCDEIPIPADTNPPAAAQVTPDMTSRELTVEITEQIGTACYGCHAGNVALNGKGFALYNFGSFGEDLTHPDSPHPGDIVYREDTAAENPGTILVTKDVDASATPKISPTDSKQTNNAVEFSQDFAASGFGHSCAVQKALEFRNREPIGEHGEQACGTLQAGYEALTNAGSMRAMIKALVTAEDFFYVQRGQP